MPKKPVTIGGILQFEKKGDAFDHFKSILNTYSPGDSVSAEHGKDLRLLITHHPNYQDKVRGGLRGFLVDDAPEENFGARTQCFYIIHSDGSRQHFSYRECIKPL